MDSKYQAFTTTALEFRGQQEGSRGRVQPSPKSARDAAPEDVSNLPCTGSSGASRSLPGVQRGSRLRGQHTVLPCKLCSVAEPALLGSAPPRNGSDAVLP